MQLSAPLTVKRLTYITSILLLFFSLINLTGCSKDDEQEVIQQPQPNVPANPVPPTPDPLIPATHEVGPDKPFKTLQEIASKLKPGDIVDVFGDNEYAGGITLSENGTIVKPITIRGRIVNGKRPVIKGGPKDRIIVIDGANTILDGLEVVGKTNVSKASIGAYADNIVIRNCVIRDSRNGIMGYGSGTGNVTIEFCEIYNCGADPSNGQDYGHQIYMATDEVAHPNAVFRLQHCYIHSGNGGNNVKSRSGRNELYYNWIEGAKYHAVELIGIDTDDNEDATHATKREDSDVVGNVIFAASNGSGARIGGDGTGSTSGRYRFVNNTFVLYNNSDGLRGLDEIETVELYNNIFTRISGQADLFSEADVQWVKARQVKGSNNYIQSAMAKVPSGLTGTLGGNDAVLTDIATGNVTLKAGSALANAGIKPPAFSGFEFPSPMFPPAFHPPLHIFITTGNASARPSNGAIDIGAFEQ